MPEGIVEPLNVTGLATSSDETDEIVVPPSDLPSDEPPLESSLHLQQIRLLMSGLNWLWKDRQDYFCTGNLTIYYSPRQRRLRRNARRMLSSGLSYENWGLILPDTL